MQPNQAAKELFDAAKSVRNHSHSPYSSYKVASAMLMDDGQIYTGVNVENASYGATICAERSAICAAVSSGAKKIKEVLVMTDEAQPWPPCGMCRQVIAEFASSTTPIHLANLQGITKTLTFGELFPLSFGADHLK